MESYNYGKKTDKEIKEECKKIYIREYIRQDNGTPVTIKTTDNFQVIFEEGRFEHAFSRERRPGLQREFDYGRARKVLWIKEVIREKSKGLTILKKDITVKSYRQRLYYVAANTYLVVLDWQSHSPQMHLKFNTAYPVTMSWKLAQVEKIFNI
jgi:hypothetical protein